MGKRLLSVILVAGLAGCSQDNDESSTDAAAVAVTGEYATCATCHGADGHGNKALGAPGLANLEADYIERQLKNFRDGIRGADGRDTTGAQMAAIAYALDDAAIASLAKTVSAMDDYIPVADNDGDATHGQDLYYHQCGACHGAAASGNKALGAPKLAGLEDWYVAAQLDKFSRGIRGSHEQDRLGAQMVFMMNKLAGQETLEHIAAYLRAPADAK